MKSLIFVTVMLMAPAAHIIPATIFFDTAEPHGYTHRAAPCDAAHASTRDSAAEKAVPTQPPREGTSATAERIPLVVVSIIVWIGLGTYLYRIDRKISRIEQGHED